jgi:hypothetical protein
MPLQPGALGAASIAPGFIFRVPTLPNSSPARWPGRALWFCPINLTRAFPAATVYARGRVAAASSHAAFCRKGNTLKTRKVSGVDLQMSSFAFVGNPDKPETWKLPVYFPGDAPKTRNNIKNSLERFAHTKIPDTERTGVWRMISGAAKAHGIRVGRQPESVAKNAETTPPAGIDEMEADLKAAREVGALAAEKLLKRMGYE